MLSCEKCRNGLSAYLDGELSALELALVEGHLSLCESCSAVLTDMKRLEPLLCSLDVPPPPPDLTSRILTEARMRQQTGGKDRFNSLRNTLLIQFWKHISPAAAALFLGLGIGVYMGLTGFQDTDMNTAQTVKMDYQLAEEHMYAISVFSLVPPNSIEAAMFTLIVDEK